MTHLREQQQEGGGGEGEGEEEEKKGQSVGQSVSRTTRLDQTRPDQTRLDAMRCDAIRPDAIRRPQHAAFLPSLTEIFPSAQYSS